LSLGKALGRLSAERGSAIVAIDSVADIGPLSNRARLDKGDGIVAFQHELMSQACCGWAGLL